MIGARDDLVERVAARLSRESGLRLDWATGSLPEGIQGLRVAGLEERHGVLLVLSRTLHRVEAALVAEAYAGKLVRTLGDHVVSDSSEWSALQGEARARGIQVLIEINGEPQAELSELPAETWRSLELECSRRVPRGGPSAEDQLASAAAICLAFLLAGLRDRAAGDGEQDELAGLEGTAHRVVETRYERDPVNRLRCIEHYGRVCWVCDFAFEETYGSLGIGYIVVHHLLPVSKMGPGYRVDPIAEMLPLCANCHAMVHRADPPLAPEVLRQVLRKDPKAARPLRADLSSRQPVEVDVGMLQAVYETGERPAPLTRGATDAFDLVEDELRGLNREVSS